MIDIEAAASSSPIVAAIARGTARHTAGDADRDPAINNNSDAEGAGSNVGGIDGSDIEGRAGEIGLGTNPRKRSLQKVSTILKRVEAIKWLVEDANETGEKGVVLRTIDQFPSEFRGKYNVKL